MATLDSDPAGGFRTKDAGAFWFGSDALPDAIVMDTSGNLDAQGAITATAVTSDGGASVGGALVLADVAEAPAAPTSGVILYSENGVLKCVDPTEAVTVLAPPPAE